MSKEFDLYEKDELNFKTKLFYLMDLLVSNKFLSNAECILLIFLSYFQIIAGFYSNDIKIFTTKGDGPDSVFTNVQNILRIKDLLYENYSVFELLIILLFVIVILQIFTFFYSIKYMNRYSNYSFREKFLNYSFKYFHYLLLTPILDLSFSVVCFSDKNPNFLDKSCSIASNPYIFIFAIIIFLYAIFLSIFLSIYYNESFFLSHSNLARTNCNYELYHNINIVIYSILLSLVKYIGKEVFMFYNIIFSIFSTRYYMNNYPYFNNTINFITGCYQFLYAWTSFFILYLSIFDVTQRSLIYIFGSIMIIWMYNNIKLKFEETIILDIPFNKITNKSHILFYVNALLKKIQTMDQNDEDKAEMIGIIQMHITECPLGDCQSKKKERIYLPLIEEWTSRQILEINDKIYLIHFITFIFNFYISQNYMSPDLYMNLAIYYLQVVGNQYLSSFFYKKVSDFKLNDQEKFSYFRLHQLIQKSLTDKLKPTNESCYEMQDLNTTMYFKYDDLGQKFFDEITSDCNTNLEFWKIFKGYKEKNDKLDFNKIFNLTNKIRISKNKIEKYWEELFTIYNGFNDMFDLYENYVGYINDDGVLCRELELIKNKILLSAENLTSNFTSVLFSKETGILIANGDKGKEGLIEHVNEQIESIFNYRSEELKGININRLMPKIFSKIHHNFMEQYNKIGEKKIVNKVFISYGKDRNNNLLPLFLRTKNFPILSEYILYISLISKQTFDDVILLDNKFNIQGMSCRLMEKFNLNENIFNDCDVPFYFICKKFISHYRKSSKEEKNDKFLYRNFTKMEKDNRDFLPSVLNEEKNEQENQLETHENAELEFEIKIPILLQNYTCVHSRRENKFEFSVNDNDQNQNDNEDLDIIEEEEDNKIEDTINQNENEENQKFLEKNILNNNQENLSDNNYNKHNNSSNNNIKYEEQEIQYKINFFKNLFDKRAFENLELELDKLNQENRMTEYKFIFTFENYKFAETYNGYIVRCIEKQFEDEISYSDGSRNKEMVKNGPLRQFTSHLFQGRKAKKSNLYEHFKRFYEFTKEDVNIHHDSQTNILKKYFEDFVDNKLINDSKEEMIKVSKIFTINLDDHVKEEDIASSHSSGGINQDEFSKKSRIMEIRSNLTKNIEKFFTLRAIKVIFLIMVVLSTCFSFVFIVNFTSILNDLLNIDNFSNLLIRSTFIFSELISNLISLNSLFLITKPNGGIYPPANDGNINKFKSFYDDKNIYFEHLKNDSLVKFSNLTDYVSRIESLMEVYLNDKSTTIYWYDVENVHLYNYEANFVLNSGTNKQHYTSFGISILEIMSNYNEILLSPYFSLNENINHKINLNLNITSSLFNYTQTNLNISNNYSPAENKTRDYYMNKLNYSSYVAIQGGYFIIIPQLLKINTIINDYLIKINEDNLFNVIILFIGFSASFLILSVLFIIFLCLTNSNMQQGLEKVSLIQIEKINETILKITDFKEKVLNKFVKLDFIFSAKNLQKEKSIGKKIIEKRREKEKMLAQKLAEDKYSFDENRKIKKLKILNSSYYKALFIVAILISILLPVFFQCKLLIDNSNDILVYKRFIIKDLISTNLNILNIKCKISNCEKSPVHDRKENKNPEYNLVYNYNFSSDAAADDEKMNQITNNYPELYDFYNNKYMLDICNTISDIDEILFKVNSAEKISVIINDCVKDKEVISSNNTVSLVNLIKDSIFNLDKEIFLKNNMVMQMEGFNDDNFKRIEYVFYKYINKVYPNLEYYIRLSLYNFSNTIEIRIVILMILFSVLIFIFSIYIYFFYIKTLINMLSISRCVLRVIPTNVIFDTPKLEAWIESKF